VPIERQPNTRAQDILGDDTAYPNARGIVGVNIGGPQLSFAPCVNSVRQLLVPPGQGFALSHYVCPQAIPTGKYDVYHYNSADLKPGTDLGLGSVATNLISEYQIDLIETPITSPQSLLRYLRGRKLTKPSARRTLKTKFRRSKLRPTMEEAIRNATIEPHRKEGVGKTLKTEESCDSGSLYSSKKNDSFSLSIKLPNLNREGSVTLGKD
jgi:hypothetical protein